MKLFKARAGDICKEGSFAGKAGMRRAERDGESARRVLRVFCVHDFYMVLRVCGSGVLAGRRPPGDASVKAGCAASCAPHRGKGGWDSEV